MLDKIFYRYTANELNLIAKKVEQLDSPYRISKNLFANDLGKEDMSAFDELKKNNTPSIYVIACDNGLIPEECHILFKDKREELKSEYAFARINEVPSKIMYVDSSKSIHLRIKQNLGYGAKKTYSLQLRHWISSLEGEIETTIYQFLEIEQQVLQVIEDALWNKLQPMFGRRGAR